MKNIIKKIIILVAYLIIMLPMMYCIYYSVPACDDFAAAYRLNGKGLWAQALDRTVSMWWTWGGRWLTQFFQVIINPLNSHEHLGHKYGIYMIVLFIITTVVLVYSISITDIVTIYRRTITIFQCFHSCISSKQLTASNCISTVFS